MTPCFGASKLSKSGKKLVVEKYLKANFQNLVSNKTGRNSVCRCVKDENLENRLWPHLGMWRMLPGTFARQQRHFQKEKMIKFVYNMLTCWIPHVPVFINCSERERKRESVGHCSDFLSLAPHTSINIRMGEFEVFF